MNSAPPTTPNHSQNHTPRHTPRTPHTPHHTLRTLHTPAPQVGYKDQALFSLCSWPFSLKLFWAPLVDSLYHPGLGRRKSWLVPVQLLCGAMMIAGENRGEPSFEI